MLGLNTFACTVNRFRPKWNLAGMMMTHFGLILILVGAFVGAVFGVKGFMIVNEGETTAKMSVGSAMQATASLPFEVKLVDFILDKHNEPGQTLIVLDVRTGRQQSHKVTKGEIIPLAKSRWTNLASLLGIRAKASTAIVVDDILPNAALMTSLAESAGKTGVAAVEFRIVRAGKEERGFALAQPDRPYTLSSASLAVGYAALASSDGIDGTIKEVMALSGSGARLQVTDTASKTTKAYDVAVGSTVSIEGTDYRITVLRYVPDFVMGAQGEIASRSELPNNPALQVEVIGPTESTKKWLFARFPDMHMTGNDTPFSLAFTMEGRFSGVRDYVLILNAADSAPVMALIRRDTLVAKENFELGQPMPLKDADATIAVDKFFKNATMAHEVVNRADLPNRPALKISLEQAGTSSPHYLWEGTPLDVPGYKMLFKREERIRDFYSILQVVDGGAVAAEKKIEVNDPLRYAGYSLYQSSYDSENLRWSGLQVKKDPGVPLVYGGFLLQILGMITIFYINPIVRKMKRSGT
jgi:cytochrome c biogenesis protein ResB